MNQSLGESIEETDLKLILERIEGKSQYKYFTPYNLLLNFKPVFFYHLFLHITKGIICFLLLEFYTNISLR